MPVKQLTSQNQRNCRFEEFRGEKISIAEDDISHFLYYFLDKYFDREFEYFRRGGDCGTRFVWYLERDIENRFVWYCEDNIYTYATVRAMIAEIRSVAEMLKNDFDNPALTELKSRFRYIFDENGNKMSIHDMNSQEKDESVRADIDITIDFYERFCQRMEAMMELAPQYDQISFQGP